MLQLRGLGGSGRLDEVCLGLCLGFSYGLLASDLPSSRVSLSIILPTGSTALWLCACGYYTTSTTCLVHDLPAAAASSAYLIHYSTYFVCS